MNVCDSIITPMKSFSIIVHLAIRQNHKTVRLSAPINQTWKLPGKTSIMCEPISISVQWKQQRLAYYVVVPSSLGSIPNSVTTSNGSSWYNINISTCGRQTYRWLTSRLALNVRDYSVSWRVGHLQDFWGFIWRHLSSNFDQLWVRPRRFDYYMQQNLHTTVLRSLEPAIWAKGQNYLHNFQTLVRREVSRFL